jgi:hypothetical protein
MKLGEGDKVVTLSTTEHDEDEINGEVEDDGTANEGEATAAEEIDEAPVEETPDEATSEE